jgi:thioesterase domain-containing protein
MSGARAVNEAPSHPDLSAGSSVHAAPGMDPQSSNPALIALFARIYRKLERVILPINDCALDKSNRSSPFYCVHSLSGAGGTDFQHLAKLMPAVRFYGIQAPPTKMQDPEFGISVESVASYYADTLTKFQPEGPFFLGGWSAGAIIGLEMAQILRARGRVVRLLVAIDAAPKNTSAAFGRWHPIYLLELTRNLPGWIIRDAVKMKRSLPLLMQRGLGKAIAQAKATIDRKRGKENVDFNAIEGFMDVSHYPPHELSFMKRLYAAILSYKPEKYAGNVAAYEAMTRPLLDLPQVGRIWSMLAPGSTIIPMKGTHLSILQPGDVDVLAEDLRQRIAEVSEHVYDRSSAAFPAIQHSQPKRKSA